MDEEASFANLLSQSTTPARPSWDTRTSDDPWANPFSDTPSTNPFASTSSPFGSTSTYIPPPADSPRDEVSPNVQKFEEDLDAGVGVFPDPPSVIAAREQEESRSVSEEGQGTSTRPISDPFATVRHAPDPALTPFSPPLAEPAEPQQPAVTSRKLPSDLLDEDILGALDPSVSLKKAFVKSTPPTRSTGGSTDGVKPKTHVFKPEQRGSHAAFPVKEDVKLKGKLDVKGSPETQKAVEVKSFVDGKEAKHAQEEDKPPKEKDASAKLADQAYGVNGDEVGAEDRAESTSGPSVPRTASPPVDDKPADTPPASVPLHLAAESIPLPTSSDATPTASRPVTPALPPVRAKPVEEAPLPSAAEPSPAIVAATPTMDRVAVSPLDAPDPQSDYGFKSLSIGAASSSIPPPPPSLSPVSQGSNGWSTEQKTVSPLSSKLSGRGWGVVDGKDDGGLFGKGGPSLRADPWGGSDSGRWGETGLPVTMPSIAGPSHIVSQWTVTRLMYQAPEFSSSTPTPVQEDDDDDTPLALTNGHAKKLKATTPLFQISVGDPTRVGDPVRGYTVYTIRTRTISPHYRRSEFSVLRRFSDFLWLFDSLIANDPGVIVPPMPDKHPFGRFQDQFIETRRAALQRCLTKITSHPVLQLDPDLRLFLESDAFAIEAKNRRAEIPPDKQGLLAGWTGPKYVEQDDWFNSRKTFLENLESQLRSLSKSIETASKTRLDMAMSMGDFADSITALAESDLGSAMCAALARLADLARREKESNEEQAKSDVIYLLNMADEYVRFIGSVRLAFAARIKAYQNWQNLEKEVVRLRSVREKLRQAGKLGDRTSSSLAEIGEVSEVYTCHMNRSS